VNKEVVRDSQGSPPAPLPGGQNGTDKRAGASPTPTVFPKNPAPQNWGGGASLALSLLLVIATGLFSVNQPVSAAPVPLYKNASAPLEARVSDLFARLTQAEKLRLLSGTDFTTQPLPHLGVPAMGMADAGQGVRGGQGSTQGPATLFPAGVTMASTWDPALIGRVGKAIGEEALNKGTGAQVLLGPAINIQRSPLGGRNGEYFSEDPFLAGKLGAGYIEGMQSAGCGACLKHYACNNEEVDRGDVNVRVSERALREIYLPAFEMGVKEAHPWTVMSSYNRINGLHATANKYLLTEVLKKCWGFDGMVMSDWGAVHETARVVAAGNDLEMPGPGHLADDKVALALKRGQITQAEIDDNVRRILRTIIRVGLLDGPRMPDHTVVNSLEHQRLTLEAASQGIVLLKNEGGLLPLDLAKMHSIAVIGPAAADMQLGAAGSPGVQPFYSINPLDGIKKRSGAGISIAYTRGIENGVPIPASALKLQAEYFANRNLKGKPALVRPEEQIQADWNTNVPAPGVARTNFSVRWTGTLTAPMSGRYMLSLTADDGSRLILDGKTLIDHWFEGVGSPQTVDVTLEAGHSYSLRVDYFQAAGDAYARLNWTVPGHARFTAATEAAARADVAIVVVGTAGTEGEGTDRPSMSLPGTQDALIQAAANKNTIIVLNNGTPVTMTKWLGQVPALIEAWFPGQEGGHALAAILYGDVNPSGKLPTTLAASREDYPDFGHFPGVNGHVDYAEGIYVGYRYFDKANIAPLFPFGYGLSYTTFQYSPITLSQTALTLTGTLTASVRVTNTGQRAGAEVVELYVHDPAPKIDRPVRELKGFQKVFLQTGESKVVSLSLTPRALAYCDVPGKQWKADAGRYELEIGASSRDIRQTAALRLTSDFTEPIPFMGRNALVSGPKPGDLAAGRPALASSVQSGYPPEYAVDSDEETRWSSAWSDPQWIAVDLGQMTRIRRVHLLWEDAYGSAYTIQVSTNGKTWTDVFHSPNGQGGVEDVKFAPTMARWVRLFGTKRATQFGYSLYSFEVYQ